MPDSVVIGTASEAARLLDGYRRETDTLIAGPGRTLRARGVHVTVPRGSRRNQLADLPERARAVLDLARGAGHDAPVLVGALPFAPEEAAHLVVPETLEVAGALQLWPEDLGEPVDAERCTVESVGGRAAYAVGVERALAALRTQALRKVVLARAIDVTSPDGFDVRAIVARLAARDRHATTFAVALPAPAGTLRTFVGASPELLLRRYGREVVARPLAGSTPRHPEPEEDARRAAALLESVKDRDEHAVVVDAIVTGLRPLCAQLEVPPGPELVSTDRMWHLASRIRGRLRDAETCSLTLAVALHPTPAVCGTPTDRARAAIRGLEPVERGFYAGAVGWQNAAGDGEWTVAIRCGEIADERMRLWVGAGIVAASDPASELAETDAKSRTLLAGLGLEGR